MKVGLKQEVYQNKEEREAKVAKTYLGNCKVVWTNGTFPEPIPYDGPAKAAPQPKVEEKEDLPF